MSVCAPGLPSYYLWDSLAALLHYQATGDYFSICDVPGVPEDAPDNGVAAYHLVIHQVPRAVLLVYPFAANGPGVFGASNNGWHFGIRLGGSDSALSKSVVQKIASVVGLEPDDVPLAMFSGLINEITTGTLDTWKGAIDQVVAMTKQAISDAMSQNYTGLAQDTINDATSLAGQSS